MKTIYVTTACLSALAVLLSSCSKEEQPVNPEPMQKEVVADSPEEILIAVSGLYSVERVTEHRDDYLFEFSSPSAIKLNKEFPDGISSVSLMKTDVRTYSEDGRNITIVFSDGRTAALTYSSWLSMRLGASEVSFGEDCAPQTLQLEILDSSTDSVAVNVSGCRGFIRTETVMEPDRRKGRIVFCLLSERYFTDSVTVSISNGKKEAVQKVAVTRKDFKFADGTLSREYSFPDYERFFEIDMHCADTAVRVSVPESCRGWILADVAHLNVNGEDRTIICFLVRENKGSLERTAAITVAKSDCERTLPVTIRQSGFGMEGSLRKGLEDFYRCLNGDSWVRNDNWCSDRPLFEWYGIMADNITSKARFGETGSVYFGTDNVWSISLSANNMRGTVPESFWKACSYFETIRISSEYLPDSVVPDCVWHDGLRTLDLSTSFMNVPLSSSVGNAKKLQYLDLSLCRVTGGLPEEITMLSELREINMSESSLTGTLPRTLGNLKKLENLYLGCNMELGGTLPESFYSLENLRNFNISMTKVGGKLSSDITRLTRLQDFEINGCEFEGTIPEEFGMLGNLIGYDFQGNYFDAIPQFVRYIAYNSRKNGQYAGSGDWVGSAGFPLGIPYFQRRKSEGRPEGYVVTVPDIFEFPEILVEGKPLKRSGYYVDYTKCFQHPFPLWAHIRYDLQSWERSCSLTMKNPQYPYADDLQYPAYQYYYDGKDWRHPNLEYPAREYVKSGDEWVHDPTCPWDEEYGNET